MMKVDEKWGNPCPVLYEQIEHVYNLSIKYEIIYEVRTDWEYGLEYSQLSS